MTISPRHSGVDRWGQRQPPVETDGAASSSIPCELARAAVALGGLIAWGVVGWLLHELITFDRRFPGVWP